MNVVMFGMDLTIKLRFQKIIKKLNKMLQTKPIKAKNRHNSTKTD